MVVNIFLRDMPYLKGSNLEMNEEKRFSWSISWLNFVLSVLVVMIHTHFEGKYPETLPGYDSFI